MNPKFQAMLESYIRNLSGQVIGAIVIVGNGASPTTFTGSQWADVSNVLWASLIPVVVRYVNKKDPAFGLIAENILKEGQKASASAIKKTAKKATAKKTSKGK
jgi:hypothetical protein